MLLIDGVKYELWVPPSEDEFEREVKKHTLEIFGENSIYLDIKQKLRSLAGIGSIPDGLAIVCGDKPEWHIIEFELSSHPLHEHIVSQVARFISGISNPNVQKRLADTLFEQITKDSYLNLKIEELIKSAQTYKFIADLISIKPVVTIVIEEDTIELKEAISALSHPQIKVVEFKTFIREGVGLLVHAHLFEPIYLASPSGDLLMNETETENTSGSTKGIRVTVKNLIESGILEVGQKIFRTFKGQKYEAEVLADGNILLLTNGKRFSSLNLATKSIAGPWDAWFFWSTVHKDGAVCQLNQLRSEWLSKVKT